MWQIYDKIKHICDRFVVEREFATDFTVERGRLAVDLRQTWDRFAVESDRFTVNLRQSCERRGELAVKLCQKGSDFVVE